MRVSRTAYAGGPEGRNVSQGSNDARPIRRHPGVCVCDLAESSRLPATIVEHVKRMGGADGSSAAKSRGTAAARGPGPSPPPAPASSKPYRANRKAWLATTGSQVTTAGDAPPGALRRALLKTVSLEALAPRPHMEAGPPRDHADASRKPASTRPSAAAAGSSRRYRPRPDHAEAEATWDVTTAAPSAARRASIVDALYEPDNDNVPAGTRRVHAGLGWMDDKLGAKSRSS